MEGFTGLKSHVYHNSQLAIQPDYELVVQKHGTERDAHDMSRMGKTQLLRVRPGWDIPLNAVLATTVISILLVSISFGSTIAFNQLTALGTVALLSSYMISIGSMALLRIRGRPLVKSHFSLGRYGLAINILSLMCLVLSFVMIFFPPARDPSPENMNWSIIYFTGVLVLSLIYYLGTARHSYVGPVKLVKKVE